MKHAKSGTSELLSTRGSVRRWFVVEPVANVLEGNNNSSSNEFALCYYKTMASQEPIGWYFLSEFEEIDEDTFLRQIILRHPCRTFRLQAEVMDEHRMWIHGLSTLCASRAKILKDGRDRYPVKVAKPAEIDQQICRIPQAKKEHESRKTELQFLQSVNGSSFNENYFSAVGHPAPKNHTIINDAAEEEEEEEVEPSLITTGSKENESLATKGLMDGVSSQSFPYFIGKNSNPLQMTRREEDDSTSDSTFQNLAISETVEPEEAETIEPASSNGYDDEFQANNFVPPESSPCLDDCVIRDEECIETNETNGLFEQNCLNLSSQCSASIVHTSTSEAHSQRIIEPVDENNWDDWDDEMFDNGKILQSAEPAKAIKVDMVALCGVAPDPNFVNDDWDQP